MTAATFLEFDRLLAHGMALAIGAGLTAALLCLAVAAVLTWRELR